MYQPGVIENLISINDYEGATLPKLIKVKPLIKDTLTSIGKLTKGHGRSIFFFNVPSIFPILWSFSKIFLKETTR